MTSEELKAEQPMVWRIFSNIFTRNRLVHAYLFAGDKTAPKKEAAILFVQSLFCQYRDKDGFACQECLSCRQIAERTSPDFKILSQPVKRVDLLALQEEFSQSGYGSSGQRAYIIENFDETREEAANALLKFFEEPVEGVTAILTCENKSQVLPTILSRSQVIQFKPSSSLPYKKELEALTSAQSANLMALYGYTLEEAKALCEHPDMIEAVEKEAAFFLEHAGSHTAVFSMQQLFKAKSDYCEKSWITFFVQWLLYLCKSGSVSCNQNKRGQMIIVFNDTLDALHKNIDPALQLDLMAYQIRKVIDS